MNDEQREFEQLLGTLTPAPHEFDVAALMFRAGRESVLSEAGRRLRRWQFATLATSVCAIVLGAFLGRVGSMGSADPGLARNEGHPPNAVLPEPPTPEPDSPQQPQIAERNDDDEPNPIAPETAPPRIPGWWSSLWDVSTPAANSYLANRARLLNDRVDAPPVRGGGESSPASPLTNTPSQTRELLEQELFPLRGI